MRVVHVNAVSGGGAFRAMERLHRGLLAVGEDSICLLQSSDTGQNMIAGRGKFSKRLWPRLDELPLRFYPKRSSEEFNIQWVPGGVLKKIRELKPDVVHLHWAHRSFVRIEDLKQINCPIVWSLHDSWAFTGGCHVPCECVNYRTGCGNCPKLGSTTKWDLSRWIWRRKAVAWRNLPIFFVTPSRWLAECAVSSPIIQGKKLKVIPNGLDLETFKPLNQNIARQVLGIDEDTRIVLFGGVGALSNKNKGYQFLEPAMAEVVRCLDPNIPELLVVGADGLDKPLNLDCPVRYIGRLHDDISLRLAYASADVTVVPSMQDNLPQMAVESLACGTPVSAFNASGLRDIVDHKLNGYLAKPYESEDLGRGIAYILTHLEKDKLRLNAREKAKKEFGVVTMAERYVGLYREVS